MSIEIEDTQAAVYAALRSAGSDGASVDELVFQMGGDVERREVRRLLKAMSRSGEVIRVDSDLYVAADRAAPEEGDLVYGAGTWTVDVENGAPVLIEPEGLGAAIAGDRVQCEIVFDNGRGRRMGRVRAITEKAPRVLEGRLARDRGHWYVASDAIGEPLLLDDRLPVKPRAGVEITVHVGPRKRNPRGGAVPRFAATALVDAAKAADANRAEAPRLDPFALIEGDERDAKTLIDLVARSMGVDAPFPDAALADVAHAKGPTMDDVDPDTDWVLETPLVTIDGADAKDFDDAVWAEAVGPEIQLVVTIADVSHYVDVDGPLDEEARRRGCSVYLPGRVYPMLPPKLSDDLCSLRPNVLRRCAWVSMMLSANGDIVGYDAGFGIMRSRARLTYEQVQDFLDGGDLDVSDEVKRSLRTLDDARERLLARRRRRGMLDLHLPEPKIGLTEDGHGVAEVEPAPRLRAHRLIEECMLAANESIADLIASKGWPSLLRVHGEPSTDKLAVVHRVVDSLGLDVSISSNPTIEELDAALETLGEDPRGRVLSWLVLRAMQKAKYSTDDTGHFGIGARRYLHFTSPIRRYPDLEVHRVLRRAISEPAPEPRVARALRHRLHESAEASNSGEQRSVSAERASDRLLRTLYMTEHVGETYEAMVSEIIPVGMFVTVTHPYVDGFVPLRMLGDEYFEVDIEGRQVIGRKSGRRIRIGDTLEVRCVHAELDSARITFAADNVDEAAKNRASIVDRLRKRSGSGGRPRRDGGGRPARGGSKGGSRGGSKGGSKGRSKRRR